jgi:hypothetical protein
MIWFVGFLLLTNIVSVIFLLNRVNYWYDNWYSENRSRQEKHSLYCSQLSYSGELKEKNDELRKREVAALGRESLANLKMTKILEIITGEVK